MNVWATFQALLVSHLSQTNGTECGHLFAFVRVKRPSSLLEFPFSNPALWMMRKKFDIQLKKTKIVARRKIASSHNSLCLRVYMCRYKITIFYCRYLISISVPVIILNLTVTGAHFKFIIDFFFFFSSLSIFFLSPTLTAQPPILLTCKSYKFVGFNVRMIDEFDSVYQISEIE